MKIKKATEFRIDNKKMYKKESNIIGIKLSRITTQEFMDYVIDYGLNGIKPIQICYLNADCVNRYFKDKEYARIIDSAEIVYADGQAVVWGSGLFGVRLPERVNAGDFFLDFCKKCEEKEIKLFFLGSKGDTSEKCANNLLKKLPQLKIVGTNDGYFDEIKEKEIIKKISELGVDILIVGMGSPLQEKWISKNIDKLNVKVCWGVGALFEYYSGNVPRAPIGMRKAGLEWLYRLIVEPKRLWKRYLIGNVIFVFRLIRGLKFK